MIEETGTIIALQPDGRALVLCQKSGACAHCSAASACGAGDDRSARQVVADNPLQAGVGDRVKIAVATRAFLRASLLLYIVPLLALVAGALLGRLLGGHLGLDADRLSAIMGTLALVAAFLALRAGNRFLATRDSRPCIIAVLDKE